MLVIAFIPPGRWTLESLLFAVWCQYAKAQLWLLECPQSFILVRISLTSPKCSASSQDQLIRGSGTFSGFTKGFLWYPSCTWSFASLHVTATETMSTGYKTIEDHSRYYSDFVQENWDSASIDGWNGYLIMKTGFTQTWQKLKEYQSK